MSNNPPLENPPLEYVPYLNLEEIMTLTKIESAILNFLKTEDRIFTFEEIIAAVWGSVVNLPSDKHNLSARIRNIRDKLGYDMIETVRKTGYRHNKKEQG